MSGMLFQLTIIISTKDRREILGQLLESITRLTGLDRIKPEVIVADNNSRDDTYEYLRTTAGSFPTVIRCLRVPRAGKSAAINDAVQISTGKVLAFLDDDVVVDRAWLTSVEEFFQTQSYDVGQGTVRLQSPAGDDPEIRTLRQRYRTIPLVDYGSDVKEIRSLNGSNFFARQDVFDRVGGFDERLGPGASGTSEDVEFAQRLGRLGIRIGVARGAVVHHRVDRSRLTDAYFRQSHWHQGKSRLLIHDRGHLHIGLELARAYTRYLYYTLRGEDRKRYRNKGRIYHYLGMIDGKRNKADRPKWTLEGIKRRIAGDRTLIRDANRPGEIREPE